MSISRQVRRNQERLSKKGKTNLVRQTNYKEHTGIRVTRDDLKSEIVADEKLTACAIMHSNGEVSHGFHSHYELRSNLNYEDASRFVRGDIPGFWTSKNRFVERNTAMNIAFHAGQIRQTQQREFLSSDVDVW